MRRLLDVRNILVFFVAALGLLPRPAFGDTSNITVGQYLAQVNEGPHVEWMRLRAGQRVYVGGHVVHEKFPQAYVCQSPEDQMWNHFECPLKAADSIVVFRSLHRVDGPYPPSKAFYAYVTAADAGWSGYVPVLQLLPIPPPHVVLHTTWTALFAEEYARPRLSATQFPGFGGGVLVGSVPVELLRYEPAVESRGTVEHMIDSLDAYVRVLGGKYTGRLGWIYSEYLIASDGHYIKCFCSDRARIP